MTIRVPQPPPGAPLSPDQRALAERLYANAVAHFRDLWRRYEIELRAIMLEMERRATFGLDHRAYVREELEKWIAMFSAASRAIDNAAALLGRDGQAEWGPALTGIGKFVTEVFGELDKAEREEADAAWRAEYEYKAQQTVQFQTLLQNIRRMH